ncbi:MULTISPECIES: hypothetical protein [unclassified Nostoc]|uniref:hypothetical protein n=2 Tax=Nostoc TaxID=1177 RepID=UPI0025EC7829|nr:hypothetical protein [Nostoc sp. JL33]
MEVLFLLLPLQPKKLRMALAVHLTNLLAAEKFRVTLIEKKCSETSFNNSGCGDACGGLRQRRWVQPYFSL